MTSSKLPAKKLTRIRGAKEQLARTSARLNGIIFSAMDAIISIDAEQRIVLFNPAAEKMFGSPAQDVLGEKVDRLMPQRFREMHARHVENFGETGVSYRRMGALGTISGLRANGEEFPLEASISQVEIDGEKLFTVILRDVSERKLAEANLHAAMNQLAEAKNDLEIRVRERTAALRQTVGDLEAFSYGLSHDMRAPLRAIRGFAQILLEEHSAKLDAHGLDLLKRVIDSADRMDRFMQNMLAFTKVSLQPIEYAPVDPEKLLRDVIQDQPEFQAPKANIEIKLPLHALRTHPASLTQCLANLLSNAVKFVPPGTVPRVRIWTEPVGNRARLWVEDNGIGISAEARNRLFQMFQRVHTGSDYEGTGIGLSLVRKAVERMGGSVGVDSEPGKGSRFWIELPAAGM